MGLVSWCSLRADQAGDQVLGRTELTFPKWHLSHHTPLPAVLSPHSHERKERWGLKETYTIWTSVLPLLLCFGVYATRHVPLSVCSYTYMCVWSCRGQRLMSSVFFSCCPPYFLETGAPSSLTSPISARAQEASPRWDYLHSYGIKGMCHSSRFFT